MAESAPGKLLVGAGGLIWAVAGAAALFSRPAEHAAWNGRTLAYGAAYATFGLAFVLATGNRLGVRGRVEALAAQAVSALVLVGLADRGFEGALLCIVAGQLPFLVPGRAAAVWLVAQSATMLVLDLATWNRPRQALVSTGAYAAFQLFAFGAARLTAREAAARKELARVHAELLATQELFADSTRTAERLRIARELHDALGHHLTALCLQLELARNVADGRAAEPVNEAHVLAKELLGELRTVVGAMREDQPIDLPRALRTLVAGIPRPRVHLEVPEDLRVGPALAHTLFRYVQEALTNAIRHADAENVTLVIHEESGAVIVTAQDDGRGAVSLTAGHGLTGLRERIESIGGRMEVESRPGHGVRLHAMLPSRQGAP
jgi:signal transduction histidine kinase